MKKLIQFLTLVILFSNCITSKSLKNKTVVESIRLQTTILSDPLFFKILKEIEAENGIDWKEGNLKYVKQDLSRYENKMDWLQDMYTIRGGYSLDSVYLWRKWNPFSSTTAVTNTCGRTTKLNKWKLNRDKYSILNTLIHERVHSFCLIHPTAQTRQENMCDASYIAGDLAEAIILYRNGISTRKMNKPICPVLLSKFKKYGLIEITE